MEELKPNQLSDIKTLISKDRLEDALNELESLIFELTDFTSTLYHESHYLLGKVYLKKYIESNERRFASEAVKAFASASNSYLAGNNASSEIYNSAINETRRIYQLKNTKLLTK